MGNLKMSKIGGFSFEMHKKIHMSVGKDMWKKMWIMWITLHTKEVFADFIHISGSHSYQHISVDTIF